MLANEEESIHEELPWQTRVLVTRCGSRGARERIAVRTTMGAAAKQVTVQHLDNGNFAP